MTTTPPDLAPAPIAEDRTVAILSYITLVGFIIAIVLNAGKKTKLGAFHLRQVLGLFVAGIGAWVIAMIFAFIPFIGFFVGLVLWVGFIVLWLIGLVSAASGQLKPVPVLGVYFEKWFGTAFE